MALTSGATLGASGISGLLGKGGMGEVYRARDEKLGRDVASRRRIIEGGVPDVD